MLCIAHGVQPFVAATIDCHCKELMLLILRQERFSDAGNLVPLGSPQNPMAAHKPSRGWVLHAPVTYESVVPNPTLKRWDQIREVMRLDQEKG